MELDESTASTMPPPTEKCGGNIKINLKSDPVPIAVPAPVAANPSIADAASTSSKTAAAAVPLSANSSPARKPKEGNSADFIHMSTFETPIHITNKTPRTFRQGSKYDRDLNAIGNFWDMVIIHHNNQYKKDEILEACFKITGNADFYPVAYRTSRLADLFLIRLCPSALSKLFQNNLQILMGDGQLVNLTVNFEVAVYESGQIQVKNKILKLLRERRKKLVVYNGLPKVLNLSDLAKDAELKEVVINFATTSALTTLTNIMKANHMELFGDVKGLLLANNDIRQLSAFGVLPKIYLHVLDISNNNIAKAEQLRQLDSFIFTEIIVSGNPFIYDPNYVNTIRQIFPVVKAINGTSILSQTVNPYAMALNVDKKPPINVASLKQVLHVAPARNAASSNAPTQTSVSVAAASSVPQPKAPAVPPTPKTKPSKSAAPPAAGSPMTLAIKGFAKLGGPPLPADPKAQAGGSVSAAGTVITSNDCSKSAAFFRTYKNSTMWHRVVVKHNGAHKKADILTNMRTCLMGTDFHPCYYMEYANCDTFFVRNAFDALEQLVIAKLSVPMHPTNAFCALSLHMNVAPFKTDQCDPLDQIQAAIGKCFSLIDKTLDLSDFGSRPEFGDMEMDLSVAPTISQVLLIAARRYLANIETVRLCRNRLTTALGMRPFTWMTGLTKLDLRDNLFKDVAVLDAIPTLPNLSDLDLRGNPLGASSSTVDPVAHIVAMRTKFPALVKMDGQPLNASGCSVVTQQNYLCSLDGYDLVEQFVQQYFSTFDANIRTNLKHLYQRQAIITMSCAFSGNEVGDQQLRKYVGHSRNLVNMKLRPGAEISAIPTFIGCEAIDRFWKRLGKTEHDFASFTIDMTSFTDLTAMFTINGLFREQASQLGTEDTLLGFVRTFVLRKANVGQGMFGCSEQFLITNEMVLFYKPSIGQRRNAFPAATSEATSDETAALTQNDKDGMVVLLQELTNLVPLWCSRFLEQASWNFKSALELFVHLAEENQVPSLAFLDFTQP